MRILIVANYNTGHFSPFVVEQVDSIRKLGVEFEYFGVVGKGPLGYLKNLPALKRKIKEFRPDIVHAHYGLSGLLATLQKKVPVIVTYHGSDIHSGGMILFFSLLAARMAAFNIFVSKKLLNRSNYKGKNVEIIACGVDISNFHPIEKNKARRELGWNIDKKYILFAGAFDREIKNATLAKEAISKIGKVELIELKGFSRRDVCNVLNASDCLLMTSNNEGSPQIIKEAMACNTPIVSVNVGDVEDVIGKCGNCYITDYNSLEIADRINKIFKDNTHTEGYRHIVALQLTNDLVAKRVLAIYNNILK